LIEKRDLSAAAMAPLRSGEWACWVIIALRAQVDELSLKD